MLNSVILDVAAGLIFAFLAVSLLTSTVVEVIASATKWRSRTLLAGVKDLVNDPKFSGLARTLYGHALVNPRGPGGTEPDKHKPAYIDSQRFAAALLDITGLTAALTAKTSMAALHATVNANVPQAANEQVNNLLRGAIQRGHGDLDVVKKEVAAWFDVGMDRVSGAYKRWTQFISFIVALVLCAGMNIDAIYIARTLWANPGIAANVKATQDVEKNVGQLLATFPVGWTNPTAVKPPVPGANTGHYGQAAIGWLITTLATMFGAPFWFDALQNAIRLKGAGPSPGEKAANKAAAV
jgi:hypothetical protein